MQLPHDLMTAEGPAHDGNVQHCSICAGRSELLTQTWPGGCAEEKSLSAVQVVG